MINIETKLMVEGSGTVDCDPSKISSTHTKLYGYVYLITALECLLSKFGYSLIFWSKNDKTENLPFGA